MGFSMSYGPAVESESRETLDKALSLGCTFWDSAAIYGKGEHISPSRLGSSTNHVTVLISGHNEQLIGDWVKQNPGSRDKLFIASKCGLPFDGNGAADNSKEHIEEYIDQSIERLGFKPDLYYLHRIEPGRDLAESIGALQGLKEAGKCRYIGLSECNAETLRNACKSESTWLSYY